MTTKELLPYIQDYLESLVNTRHVDEQELFGAVASMCQLRAHRLAALDMAQRKVTRLRALDPDRNR